MAQQHAPAICPKCYVPMNKVMLEQDLYVVREEFEGNIELVKAGALICPQCNCLAAVPLD